MMTIVFGAPFGLLDGLRDILLGFVRDMINQISQGILTTLQTLWSFVQSMPLPYTTGNALVMQGWQVMTVVADTLLGLLVLIGTIQILYGQTTGSLQMPLPQFLGRAVLTAVLIHLSAFLGETLLKLNNAIADIIGTNINMLVTSITKGNAAQTALFAAILLLVFAIGLLKLAMQGIKRIILFNLLFVLSGPAFLLSLHPYTQAVFSAWARSIVATVFEQFIQFLALGLGMQFLLASKQTGIISFIIAIAMMNLAVAIPSLVAHLVGGPSLRLDDNSIAPLVAGAVALASKVL